MMYSIMRFIGLLSLQFYMVAYNKPTRPIEC